MKRYRFLLLDIDNTILDFSRAEKAAIEATLEMLGAPVNRDVIALYSALNNVLWKRLETGAITKEQVIYGRFEHLARILGLELTCGSHACQAFYQSHLSQGSWYLPGAREVLEELQGRCELYLLTNGLSGTQRPRLETSGLYNLTRDVFISEEMGVQKPQREYYAACFARIPDFSPEAALAVGDSLTSDIQGGVNAGIDTCWFNPNGAVNDREVHPTYEIQDIRRLLDFVR